MQKTKLVKQIIGSFLEKHGFSFECFEKGEFFGGHWYFTKSVGDIDQRVVIDDFGEAPVQPGGLRMVLGTDGFGQVDLYLENMDIPKNFSMDILGRIRYENEDEFIKTLEMFKELIKNPGFEELEKRSFHTSEARRTPEKDRYIYENHEELAKKYSALLGIDPKDPANWQDKMAVVFEEVIRLSEKNLAEVEQDVFGLASVYGEITATILGGKWHWFDWKNGYPYCAIYLNPQSLGEKPLLRTFQVWTFKEYDNIIGRNERRLAKKNAEEDFL